VKPQADNVAVLVLDCDSSAGLECVQSLGRAGANVHVATPLADCLCFYSRYVQRKLPQPSDSMRLAAWLQELDQHEHYDLIIPSTEVSLLAFCSNLINGDLRRRSVVSSERTLLFARNKGKVSRLARFLKLPVPRTHSIKYRTAPHATFLFPIVVKPKYSKEEQSGKLIEHSVRYAATLAELDDILHDSVSTEVELQEYVEGTGFAVELLMKNGTPIWHFAHERIHEKPLTGGASTLRRSVIPPDLVLEDSIRLLRALKWHGVAMVEWKITRDGRHYFMEVNPRLWGSLALAIDAGVNFPVGLLNLARCVEPSPQPRYRNHYYARNIVADLEWQIANLRANHHNPLLLTKPRFWSLLELARPITFNESWDHFDAKDIGVTVRLLHDFVRRKCRAIFRKCKRRFVAAWLKYRLHPRVILLLHKLSRPRAFLFVCYGNICRSPLAAKLAMRLLPGDDISSAGFHANIDRRSPQSIVDEGRLLDIELSSHRSRLITVEDVIHADLILVMDWNNYQALIKKFPQARIKTSLLSLFDSEKPFCEITDPYDLQPSAVHRVASQIERSVTGLFRLLQNP
jgi:protein-tyrosine-phosphatase/predicted ATP-grasp superfamily ATP-dependent carboligase